MEQEQILSSARKQEVDAEEQKKEKLKIQQDLYEPERMEMRAELNAWKVMDVWTVV